MISKEERKKLSTLYRMQQSNDDENFRMFCRLLRLIDTVAALDLWLQTKPDAVLAEKIMNALVLETVRKYSPLHPMTPKRIPNLFTFKTIVE